MDLRVYVGTYKKYNEGNIEGKWLNISDWDCKDDFVIACKELHFDECSCPNCDSKILPYHDTESACTLYKCSDSSCNWRGEIDDVDCDAELMFQDHENIPEDFISESSIEESLWEFIELWNDCHLDEDVVDAYMDYESVDLDDIGEWFEKMEEAYIGDSDRHSDDEIDAWYGEYCVDNGLMGDIPDNVKYYIDYEKIGRDCRMGGDVFYVGSYVFNGNV